MPIETQIETYRGVVYPWQMDHIIKANRRGMAFLSISTKDPHEH